MPATVYGPGGRALRPTPRLSNAIASNPSARTGTVRHQPVAFMPSPMTRSTGAPAPVLSQYSSVSSRAASGIARRSLLEDAARCRRVRARELAREVRLRVRHRGHPVDLALLADLLLVV